MHVVIGQASSIQTYNMDRGGMISHGLVTQCDAHQIPNPKGSEGAWQTRKPCFYKQLSPEDLFFFIPKRP